MDVVFQCDDGKVPSHRLMWIKHSKLLREILVTGHKCCCQTAQMTSNPSTVFLPGTEKKTIRSLLKLIYQGYVMTDTEQEMEKIMQLFEIFDLDLGEVITQVPDGNGGTEIVQVTSSLARTSHSPDIDETDDSRHCSERATNDITSDVMMETWQTNGKEPINFNVEQETTYSMPGTGDTEMAAHSDDSSGSAL